MHPLNCPGHRLDSHCPFLIFIHFPLQSLFVREAGVVRQPRCSDIHFACLLEKKHSYEYSGHSAISRRGEKDGRQHKESRAEIQLCSHFKCISHGEEQLGGKQLTVKVCGAGRMAASDQAWSLFEGPILDWRMSGAAEPHDFRQACLWGETVLQEARLVRQHLSSPSK